VFRCPEGLDQDIFKSGSSELEGSYATDPINAEYYVDGNSKSSRLDGQTPYAVATWYQLNLRTTAAPSGIRSSNAEYPNGTQPTPFLWFETDPPTLGNVDAALHDQYFQRNLSLVHHSAELIMIAEAASYNWYNVVSPQTASPPIVLTELSARHGKMTRDGYDAFANFAFFDGHVASYSTYPITRNGPGSRAQLQACPDILFFLNQK
jgi:prepilin-type processing-associated H-X9-DG protein